VLWTTIFIVMGARSSVQRSWTDSLQTVILFFPLATLSLSQMSYNRHPRNFPTQSGFIEPLLYRFIQSALKVTGPKTLNLHHFCAELNTISLAS